ncbi:MAG: hypothetical protein V8Q30_11965 [Acutalibacteraceae bacterium]
MSDKKKCPFCEAIALQRFIEEHHSKPAGFRNGFIRRACFLRSSKRAQMRTDNGLHEGRQGIPAQLLPFVRKAGEE